VGENLDAMTEWELRQWAEGNRGRVSWELLDYASLKADALEARARGEVGMALALEEECDRLYGGLPRRERW
jgi:hypothetical protein